MEKLKVGQSFEVVEILSKGFYGNIYKQGGQTIGLPEENLDGLNIVQNGANVDERLLYFYQSEYKPIGKLTITSIKKGGSDE